MGTKGFTDTGVIKSGHRCHTRVWFRNSCPTRPKGLSYMQGWVLDLDSWGRGEIYIDVWDRRCFNSGMGLGEGSEVEGSFDLVSSHHKTALTQATHRSENLGNSRDIDQVPSYTHALKQSNKTFPFGQSFPTLQLVRKAKSVTDCSWENVMGDTGQDSSGYPGAAWALSVLSEFF